VHEQIVRDGAFHSTMSRTLFELRRAASPASGSPAPRGTGSSATPAAPGSR
jgi:hypothetical protein